jgi:hypothetical protein
MSFSDNLENDLKNLERQTERDPAEQARAANRRNSERNYAQAIGPNAEALKRSKFTNDLMGHSTQLGFRKRAKVEITWLGEKLRLQARDHRLELVPVPEGVMAHFFIGQQEKGHEKVNLEGDASKLAAKWLDSLQPPPPPPAEIPEFD